MNCGGYGVAASIEPLDARFFSRLRPACYPGRQKQTCEALSGVSSFDIFFLEKERSREDEREKKRKRLHFRNKAVCLMKTVVFLGEHLHHRGK